MQLKKTSRRGFRIIIILNRFVIGGPVIDTIPLAWHLKNEFDILILYGSKGSGEIEADFLLKKYPGIRTRKIRYFKKTMNPVNDLLAFIDVLHTIISTEPDIVHTHGAKPGLIGRLAAYIGRVPVVVHTFHGHFFHSYFPNIISRFMVRVERLLSRITTCCVALSKSQELELVNKYQIVPSSKAMVIPLGFTVNPAIDVGELRSAFREQYGIKPHHVAVGMVGRIVAVKNHSFFLEVIDRLLSTSTDSTLAFFIVGDGEQKEVLAREFYDKKIRVSTQTITESSRVVFTSWITEPEKVMNGLDIIVLPSHSEGTPLSLIEAQYFKKPVVATNVGGVKDIIINGVTGFICEMDVATFAERLRLLVASKELRNRMGEEGYKHVSAQFSKEKEIVATKELYFRLLRQNGYSL